MGYGRASVKECVYKIKTGQVYRLTGLALVFMLIQRC